MSHFVVEQVFSGAFEEAVSWCACALMEARYCVLVYAMLCSVQRILPHRKWGKKRNEAQLHVKRCIGCGSSSVVYFVAGAGKQSVRNIV